MTKPRDAKTIIQVYQPIVDNPEMRALIHYKSYVASLELAKEALARGEEFVDDFLPRSDICTECTKIAVSKKRCLTKQVCEDHL